MNHRHGVAPYVPEARELSAEEWAKRQAACRALDGQIKDAVHRGRQALWDLAGALYKFDEEAGWSALGFQTRKAWLAQPDVDLTESAYYAAIARWRQLVVYRGIEVERVQRLAPSNVDIVLPAIREGTARLEQALEDAASKPQKQLKREYRQTDSGRPESPTPPATPKPPLDPTPAQPVVASDLAPPSTDLPPGPVAAEDNFDIPFPLETASTEPVEPESPAPAQTLAEAIEELREARMSVAIEVARRRVLAAWDREREAVAV
jgi:hypothetical protein